MRDTTTSGERRRWTAAMEPLEGRTLMTGAAPPATDPSPPLRFAPGVYWATAGQLIGTTNTAVNLAVWESGPFDNLAVSYGGKMTVALAGTNPGTMTGTLTETADTGVADFGDLTFSTPGVYLLSGSDDQGDTTPFGATVIVTAATAKLAVVGGPTVDPATGLASLTVGVVDGQGKLIPKGQLDPLLTEPDDVTLGLGMTAPMFGEVFDAAGDAERVRPTAVNADGTETFTGIGGTAAGTYTFDLNSNLPVASVESRGVTLAASAPPPGAAAPAWVAPPAGPPVPPAPGPGGVDTILPLGFVPPTVGTTGTTTAPTPQAKRAAAKAARAAKVAAAKAAKAARLAAHAATAAEAKAAKASRLAVRESALGSPIDG